MRFFFYGTLIAGSGNDVAASVHARLGPGVAARARGLLYAIPDAGGWYPALVAVADGSGAGVVRGFLYETRAGFTGGDLAALDGWEGADYARREVEVALDDGARVTAQAYVWAGALPADAEVIAGGDFGEFIAGRGVRVFGEEG